MPPLPEIKPGEEPLFDGPRLLLCKDCGVLTKVPGAPHNGFVPDGGWPELDHIVAQHQHTEIPEHKRKGGMLFPTTQKTWDTLDPTTEVRKWALANQVWISEYKDTLMEDAGKCFRKHHSPEFPGKPCIDYKTDAKRIGAPSGNKRSIALDDKRGKLQFLCTYCPYESTVTTAKRIIRGDYAAS
jgi:hypothetical protein